MGASVLPVCLHENQIMFLFGKERDIDENPGWSDFGGGTDKGETYFETAVREAGEELTGFLGNDKDIRKMLKKHGTYNIDFKSEGHSIYRVHIVPIDYDEKLPFYYNNNQQFLQKNLDPTVIRDTKIFEKTEIKWINFDNMKKNIGMFRKFYRNVVNQILNNRTKIEAFVYKAMNKGKRVIGKSVRFRKKKNKTLKKIQV
jgi:8-oxo-dGTP pyrophosphatase MutT (NUDIX family)